MQKLIDHPNVSHAEVIECQARDGTLSNRLLVITDLALDSSSPGFDRSAYDSLMAKIQELMTLRTDIDAADLEGG